MNRRTPPIALHLPHPRALEAPQAHLPVPPPHLPISQWARSALNFHPDPLQAQILDSPSHRLILLCARQFGKSTLAAIKALHFALSHPGATILCVSPTLRRSTEWLRLVQHFFSILAPPPHPDFPSPLGEGYRSRASGCHHQEFPSRLREGCASLRVPPSALAEGYRPPSGTVHCVPHPSLRNNPKRSSWTQRTVPTPPHQQPPSPLAEGCILPMSPHGRASATAPAGDCPLCPPPLAPQPRTSPESGHSGLSPHHATTSPPRACASATAPAGDCPLCPPPLAPQPRTSPESGHSGLSPHHAATSPPRACARATTFAPAKATNSSITLPNRSRILALPGTAHSNRGYSAHLLLFEEAAFIPDPVFAALTPSVAATGGAIWLISSAGSPSGFFHEIWTNPDFHYTRVQASADQCPRITKQHLEEARLALGELRFHREYLCEFSPDAIPIFSTELLESSLDPSFEPWFTEEAA